MPIAIYVGFEQNLGVALVLSVVLIFVSVIVLTATKKLESHDY
jgi:ABC-type sulfate transport system permease component